MKIMKLTKVSSIALLCFYVPLFARKSGSALKNNCFEIFKNSKEVSKPLL